MARLADSSYSNEPPTCTCLPSQPMRFDEGIRCWSCHKRLPAEKEAIALRVEEVKEMRLAGMRPSRA